MRATNRTKNNRNPDAKKLISGFRGIMVFLRA